MHREPYVENICEKRFTAHVSQDGTGEPPDTTEGETKSPRSRKTKTYTKRHQKKLRFRQETS